jgi:hypothetical protein
VTKPSLKGSLLFDHLLHLDCPLRLTIRRQLSLRDYLVDKLLDSSYKTVDVFVKSI